MIKENDLVMLKDQQAVTSSLKVAEVFEKEHRTVLRSIDELKKDLHNFVQMFVEGSEPDSYGRDRRVYYMNRDGFTLLAMGFTGNKALKFKLKYIEAFNEMEAEIQNERAKGYQKELTGEELMARALVEAKSVLSNLKIRNSELTVENQILKPKGEYFDELVDRNLLTNLTDTAKEIGIKRKDLISFCLDNRYLYRAKKKGTLMPYQKHVTDGLFELKECFNEKSTWKGLQTMVTPKGRETFRLILGKGE
jgi:anti-repressor protein